MQRSSASTAASTSASTSAMGRHRAQPVPAYPWLKVASTVGLATLVPFTGGWVAVAAITVDLGGPSASHTTAASVLPPGTPDDTTQTASPSVVLSRSPTPSLDAVSRSGARMPMGRHSAHTTPRVTIPGGPTAQPPVRHRADQTEGTSTTSGVGGRHRADTGDQPSTTPPDTGEHRQHTGGTAGHEHTSGGQGQAGGSDDGGSPGSDASGRHGDGGNAYGHDDSASGGSQGSEHGNAYGQDDSASGGSDGSQGSEHSNGNAYGHDDSASGGSQASGGQSQGNGQGNGQGNAG